MNKARCIVCIQTKESRGFLRGVCSKCQVDVFVSAHIDKLYDERLYRIELREEALRKREKFISDKEDGTELIRLIREIVR